MSYRMVEDDGNGDGFSASGNPYISGDLCAAYRETMRVEINKITYTVKLTGAIIAIVVTIVQLGLHFFGG